MYSKCEETEDNGDHLLVPNATKWLASRTENDDDDDDSKCSSIAFRGKHQMSLWLKCKRNNHKLQVSKQPLFAFVMHPCKWTPWPNEQRDSMHELTIDTPLDTFECNARTQTQDIEGKRNLLLITTRNLDNCNCTYASPDIDAAPFRTVAFTHNDTIRYDGSLLQHILD